MMSSQSGRKSVICVIGTRPEAIKMAPLILELYNDSFFDTYVLATGQHRDMLYQALSYFDIKPDFDLAVMKEKQSLDHITAKVIEGTGKIYDEVKPDIVMVHGDTTTTFASALSAFYRHIPVAHVEAGLRSHDINLPFPEEANRILTDAICSLWFPPTLGAQKNLVTAGLNKDRIFVTGNTVVDALVKTIDQGKHVESNFFEGQIPPKADVILMTTHRREYWGEPLRQLCSTMKSILEKNENVWLVLPVHKNPVVRKDIYEILDGTDRVILTEPLDYRDFVWAMDRCKIIVTDSGGIQEEGTSIKKPVLVTRDVSERPEAISEGTAKLVGHDMGKLQYEIEKLLEDKKYYNTIVENAGTPFGDGKASVRIKEITKKFLENRDEE